MKRRILFLLAALSLIIGSGVASADIFCGYVCAGSAGNAICQGPVDPTVGCSYVGGIGNCMSGYATACGGDPGCGFDGRHCPLYPEG